MALQLPESEWVARIFKNRASDHVKCCSRCCNIFFEFHEIYKRSDYVKGFPTSLLNVRFPVIMMAAVSVLFLSFAGRFRLL